MMVYNYSETHCRASLHSFFKALELKKAKKKNYIKTLRLKTELSVFS